MIISVILGWNDTPIHPIPGSEDERRYPHYTVARSSALIPTLLGTWGMTLIASVTSNGRMQLVLGYSNWILIIT